jgi:hypothetical protein
MIKMYQFYSAPLATSVTVSYDDGMLKSVEAESPNFSIVEKAEAKYHMFMTEEGFVAAANKSGIKLIEIKRDITFEMFWDKYNYKTSGKEEAKKAWTKLSKSNQTAAYDYISVYESILKQNPVAKQYGSSYLNAKRWIK